MNAYQLPLIGLSTFILFLLFTIAIRVGRGQSPYRTMTRLHFFFGIVYFLAAYLYQRSRSETEFTPLEWAAGFYVYFALYHAFFAHVFATFMRGFSIEICVALHELGGKATHQEIATAYHSGKGIDFVKNERIEVLVESEALKQNGDQYTLTPFGEFAAKLNQVLLTVWSLRYLGLGKGDAR